MKFLVVLFVALACVAADVSHLKNPEASAPILESKYRISPEDGSYKYVYKTGNGISELAKGLTLNYNSENPSLQVEGKYRYPAPDGTFIELFYTADENGFHPLGSHLPVPPEIPEQIARSLAYIAAHPPPVARV